MIGHVPNFQLDVLVILLNFNQSSYLNQAVNSVLMQDFEGSMRVLIHDDASIDNSQVLIQELCARFPDTVIGILQSENVFSRKYNIIQEVSRMFNSKYIARLDADDYWNSKEKIQAQFEALETNSLVSIVCHPCYFLNEMDGSYKLVELRKSGIINSRNLAFANFIQSPSVMFRSSSIEVLPESFTDFYIQDWPLWAAASKNGKIQYLQNIYSTYRIHGSNGFAGKRNIAFANTRLGITKMIRNFLPPPNRKYWSVMVSLRVIFGFLDRNISHNSLTILNTFSNKIIGLKITEIDELK